MKRYHKLKRFTGGLFDVPYRSQEDSDSAKFRFDCGPACVGMILDWKSVPYIPTNTLSSDTSLAQHDNGLLLSEVAALLNHFNVQSKPCDDVEKAIDAGHPVIALVRYGEFKARMNTNFSGLHFVVVVGFDENRVMMNDPDWYTPRRSEGIGFAVPWSEWNAGYIEGLEIL